MAKKRSRHKQYSDRKREIKQYPKPKRLFSDHRFIPISDLLRKEDTIYVGSDRIPFQKTPKKFPFYGKFPKIQQFENNIRTPIPSRQDWEKRFDPDFERFREEICRKRKERREALFKTHKTGKGAKALKIHDFTSKIKC